MNRERTSIKPPERCIGHLMLFDTGATFKLPTNVIGFFLLVALMDSEVDEEVGTVPEFIFSLRGTISNLKSNKLEGDRWSAKESELSKHSRGRTVEFMPSRLLASTVYVPTP